VLRLNFLLPGDSNRAHALELVMHAATRCLVHTLCSSPIFLSFAQGKLSKCTL